MSLHKEIEFENEICAHLESSDGIFFGRGCALWSTAQEAP